MRPDPYGVVSKTVTRDRGCPLNASPIRIMSQELEIVGWKSRQYNTGAALQAVTG